MYCHTTVTPGSSGQLSYDPTDTSTQQADYSTAPQQHVVHFRHEESQTWWLCTVAFETLHGQPMHAQSAMKHQSQTDNTAVFAKQRMQQRTAQKDLLQARYWVLAFS